MFDTIPIPKKYSRHHFNTRKNEADTILIVVDTGTDASEVSPLVSAL